MTRGFLLGLTFAVLGAAPAYAQHAPDRFEPAARLHDYTASLTDVYSWASVAGSTLIDQLRDDPESWDFGDRALSNAARFVLEESIYHGVAALQDRSTWYYPCECTGIPARSAHAFAEAFTDHDRTGAAHVSVARIAAPYSAALAETLWRPDASVGDALFAGSTSLVFTGLFNIVREFMR
jgi:hypothetical protein